MIQITQESRIGFIGASGLMGHGIAKNLAAQGFQVSYTVHRREPAGLAELGATKADSPAQLGHQCAVVGICVTGTAQVRQVVAGPDGLLSNPAPGLIIVDHSTSEPAVTRELAAQAAQQQVSFVDAPLTRGPAEAEAGKLNLLLGADDDVLAALQPYFAAFAENVFHCGSVGAGHTVKLVNNTVYQSAMTMLAEGFAVCAKAGVDPQKLVDVMSAGGFNNVVLHLMEATLHGDFDVMAFQLDNARKDVRYYTRLAADLAVPAAVGAGVHESLSLASALGFGDEFCGHLTRAQAKLNSVQIKAG